jgi:hypothetical protein
MTLPSAHIAHTTASLSESLAAEIDGVAPQGNRIAPAESDAATPVVEQGLVELIGWPVPQI